MKISEKTAAVILAAGSGTRMRRDIPKQNMLIAGKTVLWHTLRAFECSEQTDEIVLVVRKEDAEAAAALAESIKKPVRIVVGGETRQASAFIGVRAVSADVAYVAVHDGARCLVLPQLIDKTVAEAKKYGAAFAAVAVTDTLKRIRDDGKILQTVSREGLYAAQTPQVFSKELYERGMAYAEVTGVTFTDDCCLTEAVGHPAVAVPSDADNIKITWPSDIERAEKILEGRRPRMEYRMGQGYDVHRLTEGRRLIIGGVDIPHDKGLLGHSDADVLLHAVMDALLGAVGEGDIGRHFPDTDETYRGISGMKLLSAVADILNKKGAVICNIDATVILQKPKIAPYIPRMRENVAVALGTDVSRVNIKATTEEHLGFTGREEGAAAEAVALISVT